MTDGKRSRVIDEDEQPPRWIKRQAITPHGTNVAHPTTTAARRSSIPSTSKSTSQKTYPQNSSPQKDAPEEAAPKNATNRSVLPANNYRFTESTGSARNSMNSYGTHPQAITSNRRGASTNNYVSATTSASTRYTETTTGSARFTETTTAFPRHSATTTASPRYATTTASARYAATATPSARYASTTKPPAHLLKLTQSTEPTSTNEHRVTPTNFDTVGTSRPTATGRARDARNMAVTSTASPTTNVGIATKTAFETKAAGTIKTTAARKEPGTTKAASTTKKASTTKAAGTMTAAAATKSTARRNTAATTRTGSYTKLTTPTMTGGNAAASKVTNSGRAPSIRGTNAGVSTNSKDTAAANNQTASARKRSRDVMEISTGSDDYSSATSMKKKVKTNAASLNPTVAPIVTGHKTWSKGTTPNSPYPKRTVKLTVTGHRPWPKGNFWDIIRPKGATPIGPPSRMKFYNAKKQKQAAKTNGKLENGKDTATLAKMNQKTQASGKEPSGMGMTAPTFTHVNRVAANGLTNGNIRNSSREVEPSAKIAKSAGKPRADAKIGSTRKAPPEVTASQAPKLRSAQQTAAGTKHNPIDIDASGSETNQAQNSTANNTEDLRAFDDRRTLKRMKTADNEDRANGGSGDCS